MKTNVVTLALVALATIPFLAGCAEAPLDEVNSAKASIETARDAEANLYAPSLFQAAEESFAAAQAEIDHQNGKFAITRSYKRPLAQLDYVIRTAAMAKDSVAVGKERMRVEADNLIGDTRKTIATAKRLIPKTPQKKGSKSHAVLRKDVASIDSTLKQAQTALTSGNIYEAYTLSQRSNEMATRLTAELNAAGNGSRATRR